MVRLEVAGFEIEVSDRTIEARTTPLGRRRIRTLEPRFVRWIVARAGALDETGRPHYSYSQIGRNFWARHGIRLTSRQIVNLVRKTAPLVYSERARGEKRRLDLRRRGTKFIRARRMIPGAEKIGGHWLIEAFDKIERGEHEADVMARFGYAKMLVPDQGLLS